LLMGEVEEFKNDAAERQSGKRQSQSLLYP
jgi:hypothetical protein